MDCPYDAVSLHPRRLESDVQVDGCPICAGVWLHQGELEAIQASHSHDRIDPDPDSIGMAFEMARQEARPPGPCPVCGEELSRREYAYTSQVMIESCPRGHGLWLDEGELRRLEQFFARQQREAPKSLWATLMDSLSSDR